MYLEISPRRTGKTNRLVKAAAEKYIDIIDKGESTNILLVGMKSHFAKELDNKVRTHIHTILNEPVIHNNIRAERIKNMIHKRIHYTTDAQKYINQTPEIRGTIWSRSFDNWMVYYDEFDMIENVVVDERFYYSTTAKKTRNTEDLVAHAMGKPDALLDLLRLNGGMHVTHSITNFLEDMKLKDIRSLSKQYSHEMIDIEFGNQYVKTW